MYYINLHNENYGYSVATFGDFVAVGNPAILRYDPTYVTQSRTGSVDVFKYNYRLDQHDLVDVLYKKNFLFEILLAAETGSLPLPSQSSSVRADLHTEIYGDDSTRDKDLYIDDSTGLQMLEDGYGLSLDIYKKVLAVGCPYYYAYYSTNRFTASFIGSFCDLVNLGKY